jgi:hypothetical protein
MKPLIVILVLLCGTAFSQTAQVVELTKTEAENAKQLYEAKQGAEKAWDEAYDKILQQYLSALYPCSKVQAEFPQWRWGFVGTPDTSSSPACSDSFQFGAEFSKDFRFIVPKSSPVSSGTGTLSAVGCTPGIYATPATLNPGHHDFFFSSGSEHDPQLLSWPDSGHYASGDTRAINVDSAIPNSGR